MHHHDPAFHFGFCVYLSYTRCLEVHVQTWPSSTWPFNQGLYLSRGADSAGWLLRANWFLRPSYLVDLIPDHTSSMPFWLSANVKRLRNLISQIELDYNAKDTPL
jgi:hypothetical protein